jgi:hypothetical protein
LEFCLTNSLLQQTRKAHIIQQPHFLDPTLNARKIFLVYASLLWIGGNYAPVFYDHISVGTTAILYKITGTHSLSSIWLFSCQYTWWLELQRRNHTWITKLQFTHVIGGGGGGTGNKYLNYNKITSTILAQKYNSPD